MTEVESRPSAKRRRGAGEQIGAVLTVARKRETGWIHLELGDESWTVAAVAGNAHAIVGEPMPDSLVVDPVLASRFGEDAARLVEALSRFDAIKARFVAAEEGDLGRLGPSLPLLPLLAEAATYGRNTADLWHALGGRRSVLKLVKAPNLGESQISELAGSSHTLLARLLQPKPVEDIVNEEGGSEAALAELVQLQTLGLIRQVRGEESQRVLSRSSLDLFLGRVARELEARPIQESPQAHREKVADLLRNFGVWSHYELLGVDRHDDEGDVHRGYVGVAKLAHPSSALRLGLEGHDAALLTIFEVATHAYLTLSHPDRRREYDRELGPEIERPDSEKRRAEKAAVARDMYVRARRMVLQEEFQPVLGLMQQAIQLDPQAEYYLMLGEVQRRNPEWRSGALASYRDAVRCRPDDADLRMKFAKALEEMGDKEQAGIQFRAAIELRPELEAAQEEMEAFEERVEPEERSPVLRALKALMSIGR